MATDSMRFPGGYVPAEAPIPDYVGLKKMPEQQQAGMEMAAPFVQAAETTRVRSAQDDETRKAEQFRTVLQGGPDLMYKFSDEVAQKYPEFGKQLRTQVDGYAPLFKDPKLDRAGVQDLIVDFYKNANDRMNELDKSSKGDPLLDLKRKNLQSMIDSRKARDRIAAMTQSKKTKSAKAAAKAWDLAENQLQSASDRLETLLAQTSGTHSPKWQEQIDQAQNEYNKAAQYQQSILLKIENEDFFDLAPGAEPPKPVKEPAKPAKRKYSIVEVK